jgi:lipopolysaccharide transport system ATP-binding protein
VKVQPAHSPDPDRVCELLIEPGSANQRYWNDLWRYRELLISSPGGTFSFVISRPHWNVAKSGRTVLFVSHNMATIQRLCTRGLFLEAGRLVEDGPIAAVVSRYNADSSDPAAHGFSPRQRSGSGWALITDIRVVDADGQPRVGAASDENLDILVDITTRPSAGSGITLRGLVLELMFFNQHGQPLWSVMNVDDPGVELPDTQSCTVRMHLAGPTLVPGNYRIGAFLGIPYLQHVDELPGCFSFQITPPLEAWRPYDLDESHGNSCRKAAWSLE